MGTEGLGRDADHLDHSWEGQQGRADRDVIVSEVSLPESESTLLV